jgi:hypothetical protein
MTQQEIIDIENSTAFKTIKAFKETYRSKGLEPSENDLPNDYQRQLTYLQDFAGRLDASKQVTKRIISMVRQPVSSRENGKRVVKDSLTFHCQIDAFTFADIPISIEVSYGYHLSPDLRFSLSDTSQPFDPITGEKRGEFRNMGLIWNHDIFLPDNIKDRTKFLNKLLDDWQVLPEEVTNLIYRTPNAANNHSSSRGPVYNWTNFTELSLEQLGELQSKKYYRDSKNTLRDQDQNMVSYDSNTNKVTAIQ